MWLEERKSLEQACRYITHPALVDERVRCNAAGQLVMKLKMPWRSDMTLLVISPLEFMQPPIQGPLCGSQIRRRYVSSGST